jgi:hypothetical protein
VLVLIAPSVLANQVIHFTNGVTLPVRSVDKRDGMYHVDLGGNGRMAFPAYLVERIERSDRVKLSAGTQLPTGSKLMTATSYASGSDIQEGLAQREAQLAQQAAREEQAAKVDSIQVDSSGTVVHRPHAGSRGSARQNIGLTGSMGARNSTVGGRPGAATRVGGKYVLNGNRQTRRQPTGISPVAPGPDERVPVPPTPAPGSGSSSGDSSGDGSSGDGSSGGSD